MDIISIIAKKKFGEELTGEEIGWFIRSLPAIPDYQTAAFLMAVRLNGMTASETAALTLAMAESGQMLNLAAAGGTTVDKHSSGGVSDATTFVVAPILAAAGLKVVKLSGRGLGHTGGTIDKLEAFRGFEPELTAKRTMALAKENGVVIAAQSGELAPADKTLYALRDVTSTVDSIPLIASSIMSKKIAGGARIIVLDVKYGGGAFMKTAEQAEELAEVMVSIGNSLGRKTAALITAMDEPLGEYIGSIPEIFGALEVLKGKRNSLREVSLALSRKALELAGREPDEAEILLDSGAAYEKFVRMIEAQGGDISSPKMPEAAAVVRADRSGYISAVDCEGAGLLNIELGGGRKKKGDIIDHSAGMRLCVRTGDYARKGDILGEIYTAKNEDFCEDFLRLFTFSDEKPVKKPLIYTTIG